MDKKSYLFTSESVSEGHPDKVCDRISDMVVDTYLSKEPLARVACETLTTTNKVVVEKLGIICSTLPDSLIFRNFKDFPLGSINPDIPLLADLAIKIPSYTAL